jgi:FkbM family methyltransferase
MSESSIQNFYRDLSKQKHIPMNHVNYLWKLKNSGFEPKVIYDIGSCVLHWTNEAKLIWPDAEIICFEALDILKFLYEENNVKHSMNVLSDQDNKELKFYVNYKFLGGNSYYKENDDHYYPEDLYEIKHAMTLDTIVKTNNFPLPDFIKIDVQGAEVDILKGALNTLQNTKRMVIELQSDDYNRGAPKVNESLPFIESLGFKCTDPLFQNNGHDGDYGFERI